VVLRWGSRRHQCKESEHDLLADGRTRGFDGSEGGFRRNHHRRRGFRPLSALQAARTRAPGAGVRSRHRRRRHLVLERYPGARFDSESWTYGYSFSQELLEEWDWEEHFAGQPETERYLNYVADKFDLRRDIEFKSRVRAAHYQEDTRSWGVELENGRHYSARFLITAVGVLSAATMPTIPGVETFQDQSCHTHYWPKEPVRFAGKRVAVIGTGATGVQTITEVAKTAGHLTVFQRTPQWWRAIAQRARSVGKRCAGSGLTIPISSRAARRPTAVLSNGDRSARRPRGNTRGT